MKLTQATTADLKCPPDRSELMVYDDQVAGFGLRVNRGWKALLVRSVPAGDETEADRVG